MQSTITTRRRIASGLAGTLALGLTAALGATMAPATAAPAAAQAAPSTDLAWGVSTQFVEHLFFSKMGPVLPTEPTGQVGGGAAHVPGDPATSADDVFTFQGVRTVREADGDVVREYAGSVTGRFVAVGAEQYRVTIADPSVSVDATGAGRITATVSSSSAASDRGPGAEAPPVEVTVAEFSGATSDAAVLTATPAWEGVLAAGSAAATELALGEGVPVEGRSFHPELYQGLVPGVRAHFYASGARSDANKAPRPLTAASAPTVTATATATATGVQVRVAGAGFNPTTLPGDNGVYVGLAPADKVIDFDDRGSMSTFAAVDWVNKERFTDGSFTSVLNAEIAKLEKGKEYAVFTWQAHTHSNATQDTRTPVTIDWSAFEATKPRAKTKVKPKATTKRQGRLVVQVQGRDVAATGKVKVTINRAGVKRKAVRTVKLNRKAKAVVKLPRAKKRGAYRVVVQYQGDAANTKVRKVVKFRVNR